MLVPARVPVIQMLIVIFSMLIHVEAHGISPINPPTPNNDNIKNNPDGSTFLGAAKTDPRGSAQRRLLTRRRTNGVTFLHVEQVVPVIRLHSTVKTLKRTQNTTRPKNQCATKYRPCCAQEQNVARAQTMIPACKHVQSGGRHTRVQHREVGARVLGPKT